MKGKRIDAEVQISETVERADRDSGRKRILEGRIEKNLYWRKTWLFRLKTPTSCQADYVKREIFILTYTDEISEHGD